MAAAQVDVVPDDGYPVQILRPGQVDGRMGWHRALEAAPELLAWPFDRPAPRRWSDRAGQISDLLALAIWRTTVATGKIAQDLRLIDVATWLAADRHTALIARPLPVCWSEQHPVDWEAIIDRIGELAPIARDMLVTAHSDNAIRDLLLTDTPGGPAPEPLIGVRVLEAHLSQELYQLDRHPTAVKLADLEERAHTGTWQINAVEAAAAQTLLPVLHPPRNRAPDAGDPATPWLRRIRRLADLHHSVPHLVYTGERLDLTALGGCIDQVQRVCWLLYAMRARLDRWWTLRPAGQGAAEWDRAHIPIGVRQLVEEVDAYVDRLAGLCQLAITPAPNPSC